MSFTRRGFLQGLALGAVAGTAKAGSVTYFPGYPGRMGLLHDSTLCVGCRSCEYACNKVNELAPPTAPIGDLGVMAAPRKITDKLYTVVNRYQEATPDRPAVFRKHQCMHCNEPCCASVCFVKAFRKTPEGPVLYDPELCVGCRYCVFACPYYALAYEYADPLTPRVVRCTMCYPRIKQKLPPACAEVCPTGAIQYGPREGLLQVAHERIRKYPGRYQAEIFGENEYGGTSWLTLAGIPYGRLGLPEHLPREPLPNLTTGFLSLAPLVTAIFPGLLAGFYTFSKRRQRVADEEQAELVVRERARAQADLKARLEAAAREARLDRQIAVEEAVKEALRSASVPAAPVRGEEEKHG